MKITCPAIMEAPLMNLIKLYDSLDVVGVCGILTSTTQNVKGTTISALALMAYCNDLIAQSNSSKDLEIIDISLPSGAITYQSIVDASHGALSLSTSLTTSAIIMSTEQVSFKLVIGRTTPQKPLTEARVSDFIISQKFSGLEFTAMPLPLMTKKIVSFTTQRDDQFSTIETNDVRDSILKDLMSQL